MTHTRGLHGHSSARLLDQHLGGQRVSVLAVDSSSLGGAGSSIQTSRRL